MLVLNNRMTGCCWWWFFYGPYWENSYPPSILRVPLLFEEIVGKGWAEEQQIIVNTRIFIFPAVSYHHCFVLCRVSCSPVLRQEGCSVQFSSVAQLCPTLCDPMNHSTPGLPVHHQLPEFTQTHVHQLGDAIQPSHPLLSPFPPAPNPSQHQSLFQWVSSSHEVAKLLEFQLLHQSFQRTPRTDLLQNGLVGSPCSPWDSQESSPTPQFKSINSSVLSFLHSPTHIHTWPQEKP